MRERRSLASGLLRRPPRPEPERGFPPRWLPWLLGSLVAVRVILPYAVEAYANREFSRLPDYYGELDDVDLSLWRGAYKIEGLRLMKTREQGKVPFFACDAVWLSLDWGALLQGRVRSAAAIERPVLNVVAARAPEPPKKPLPPPGAPNWQDRLRRMTPFRIDRFEIDGGSVNFSDETKEPPLELKLDRIDVIARNLTNVAEPGNPLPASVQASARVFGAGRAGVSVRLDPLAELPTFDLDAAMRDMPATALNDFLRAYANGEAQSGRFSLFVEATAADGLVRGYAKPVFEQLKIFRPGDAERNVAQRFWAALVEGTKDLFEDEATGRLAARIPFSGPVERPEAGVWPAVVSVLRNAFVRALVPSLEGSVRLPPGEAAAPPKPKARPRRRRR